jgi:hypothetical protein
VYPCWGIFIVGVALALVLIFKLGTPVLVRASGLAWVVLFVVVLGASAMGYWAGSPRREDQVALGYVAALGNPALALAVAAYSNFGPELKSLLAAYVLARLLALIPYGLLVKRKKAAGPRKRWIQRAA